MRHKRRPRCFYLFAFMRVPRRIKVLGSVLVHAFSSFHAALVRAADEQPQMRQVGVEMLRA